MPYEINPALSPPTKPARSWNSAIRGYFCGVLSVVLLIVATSYIIYLSYASSRMPARTIKTPAQLLAALDNEIKLNLGSIKSDLNNLAVQIHEQRKKDPQCDVNFLLISGGADKGAFGSGFLRGWGEIALGEHARPNFDGVSGVSVGGLIAPFAYLGNDADYTQIDELLRHPNSNWIKPHGRFFFLPDNVSFMDVSGLEREVQSTFNIDFAKRIVAAKNNYRMLLIQATNVDLCIPHVFDVVDASQQAITAGNTQNIEKILLASTAIPGGFPPREINGNLYADGGLAGSFYDGTGDNSADEFGTTWKRLYPNESIPTLHYWIILNDYRDVIPKTIQPTWPALFERTIESGLSYGTKRTLEHLYKYAEASRLRGDGDIQVRWISIPTTWRPMNDAPFDAENMKSLSDLGRSMGSDPNSWNTKAP